MSVNKLTFAAEMGQATEKNELNYVFATIQ